jgi:succinate dehydrogenase/fumarate reductase iron-sulfur protein
MAPLEALAPGARGNTTVEQGALRSDARRIGQIENRDTNEAKLASLKEDDRLRVRVKRYDPTRDAEPYFQSFEVPYSKWMRVLDVLIYISEELESDLSYRWYCGSKMCGSCAMRVNGREILACWAAAEPEMTIEPLRNVPVLRDLTIDRAPYEKRVLELKPWIERTSEYAGFPEPLTHKQMKHASRALDCISCMACYSACPVVHLGDVTNFAGPAPLVQVGQRALDPRDGLHRAYDLIEHADIFSCVSCYRCEEVCPASIPIVSGVIEPLKALAYRTSTHKPRHPHIFSRIIARRGRIDPTELVLKVRGLGSLRSAARALRLLVRGKIDPFRTLLGKPIEGIARVRRIFRSFH